MTVLTEHFPLSSEQKRFATLLERRPSLMTYWDLARLVPQCDVPALEKRMASMSDGEQILAAFFLDLWLSDGAHRFDLHNTTGTLDADAFAIIQEWTNDPFFP